MFDQITQGTGLVVVRTPGLEPVVVAPELASCEAVIGPTLAEAAFQSCLNQR